MVEVFSSRYYLTQLYVVPYNGGQAVVDKERFDRIQRLYMHTRPLVFKIGNSHIPAHGEAMVPPRTLALPREQYDQLDIEDGELTNVLLANDGTVEQFLSIDLVDGDE